MSHAIPALTRHGVIAPGAGEPQDPGAGVPQDPGKDPLWGMLRLGARASRDGLVVGALLTLLLHGLLLGSRFASLFEMRDQVTLMRDELHDFFWMTYPVDVVEDETAMAEQDQPPEEPPVEEPEAEPPPAQVPPPEPEEDPYANDDPPAPAEAADVLAHDEGIEIPGMFTVPDKDGSKSTGGGFTSAKGTDKRPVKDKNAKVGGREGAKGGGDGKGGQPRPKKSLARSPRTSGSRRWDCPFPPQADLEQVDHAVATVAVKVSPDGKPLSAHVVSDPGYGFGQMAKRCAMSQRYQPGLDSDGNRITSTTPPINVTFTR